MLKLLIKIIVILLSLLQVTGCFPDRGKFNLKIPGGTDKSPAINKPMTDLFESDEIKLRDLKAVEMDLTFSDLAASMLKINQLMLNMKVSGGAEWPKMLVLTKQDFTEGYTLWLRDQSKKNFSFLEMYQDFFMIDVKFFGCWTTVKERLFIEAMKKISFNLEHQKQIIDYRPEGCGGPNIIFQNRNKRQKEECEKLIESRKQKCSFFDDRLEDQLYSYMTNKKAIIKWINAGVNSSCLRSIKSPKHRVYKNFEEAFYTLLPKDFSLRIKKCKNRIEYLNTCITEKEEALNKIEIAEKKKEEEKQNERKKIQDEIKTIKQEMSMLDLNNSNLNKFENLEKKLIKNEEILESSYIKEVFQKKNRERKEAINKNIKDLQNKISTQKNLYQKLLEDSLDTPKIYKNNNNDTIDLIRNLKRLASAVYNNLNITIASSSVATTKLIYDLKTMNSVRLNIDKVSKTLAYEFILRKMYNKMSTSDKIKLSLFSIFTWGDTTQQIKITGKELNQTKQYMNRKWNKLLKKSFYILPFTIKIANQVKFQHFVMKLKKQYLEKLDNIIKKTRKIN